MSHDSNKEFDGIKQADNPLPPWWKAIFIISIVFSVGYVIYFHGYSRWGTEDYYADQVAAHEEKFPKAKEVKSADGSNPFRGDAGAIKEGHQTFLNLCAACHKPDATGLVGPDLTDGKWLHGNTDAQVYLVIMKGVSADKAKTGKGAMPAHELSLGSEKVYQVMAWMASNNKALLPKK